MKLLPERKLFIVGYVIGAFLNFPNLLNIGSIQDLLIWLFVGNLINGIFVMGLVTFST